MPLLTLLRTRRFMVPGCLLALLLPAGIAVWQVNNAQRAARQNAEALVARMIPDTQITATEYAALRAINEADARSLNQQRHDEYSENSDVCRRVELASDRCKQRILLVAKLGEITQQDFDGDLWKFTSWLQDAASAPLVAAEINLAEQR